MFYDKKLKQAKQCKINIFLIVINLIKFHTWKYFYIHVDDSRKTGISAYLNLQTKSQKNGKSWDF